MANRIPLVVDGSNYRIEEIPSGDTLDLNASTVTGFSAIGVSTIATLNVSGVGTITGKVLIESEAVGYNTSFGSKDTELAENALYVKGGVGIGSTLQVIGDIYFAGGSMSGIVTASNSLAIGRFGTRSDNIIISDISPDRVNTLRNTVGIAMSNSVVAGTGVLGNLTGAGDGFTGAGWLTLYGNGAGEKLINSSFASFFGASAGAGYSGGTQNVAVGGNAAGLIGVGAGGTMTGSNNICIGYQSQVSSATTSNQIVLGDANITSLRCNVTTISAISDARDKKDVVDLPIGLEFIDSLRPVKFEWDRRDGSMAGIQEAGFIAQELDAAQGAADAEDYLRLVLKDNPEQLEAAPGKLIPVLVKAIQELKAEVDALKNA